MKGLHGHFSDAWIQKREYTWRNHMTEPYATPRLQWLWLWWKSASNRSLIDTHKSMWFEVWFTTAGKHNWSSLSARLQRAVFAIFLHECGTYGLLSTCCILIPMFINKPNHFYPIFIQSKFPTNKFRGILHSYSWERRRNDIGGIHEVCASSSVYT